jgi:hypothetical protein
MFNLVPSRGPVRLYTDLPFASARKSDEPFCPPTTGCALTLPLGSLEFGIRTDSLGERLDKALTRCLSDGTPDVARQAGAHGVSESRRGYGYACAGRNAFPSALRQRLASRLMQILYGLRVTDLGPYRAIKREMMVKAARRRARMKVPVSYHPRRSGCSKVSGTLRGALLAAYHILAVTFRYAF